MYILIITGNIGSSFARRMIQSLTSYVEDENGILLRDAGLVRERWARWFHTLLNIKSPKLDLNIVEGLDRRPENMPLGVQSTMQELTDTIR